MIFVDGSYKILLLEVGPVFVEKYELAIGRLPQEEVADPPLSAGPNDQVGIGNPSRGECGAHILFADLIRVHGASNRSGGKPTRRLNKRLGRTPNVKSLP